ncbi:MAG: hypothetical protein H6556_18135 [Lewinellaceae bacterium]|nr:hypothetical protein [Lewinellaceae bacterium]
MRTSSPFLDGEPITKNPNERAPGENQAPFSQEAESPFLSVFEASGQEGENDPKQEALVELMDELFDEEFEDGLQSLAQEAMSWQDDNSFGNSPRISNQLFEQHYAPLLQEVERFLDYGAEVGAQYDRQELSDEAFEAAIESFQPLQSFESPQFDQFFGKLKKWGKKAFKAAKSLAKKGWNLAKKIGLGPVLKKIKGYVMKFLKGFLKKAMNKVPASLRPYAEKLRSKYFGKSDKEAPFTESEAIQSELNLAVAEFFLASTPEELELNFEAFLMEDETQPENPPEMLHAAREQLVQRLGQLEEGESPEPAVEEFVTAALTGLKWAIRIIGRKRVKGFLAKQLSRITSKLIARKNARKLSRLIVDQGFKMLNLELSEAEATAMGNQAIAATIEDTLLQASQLPAHVLENEALLEGHLLEAFEQAAKVNLPDMLSEEAYRQNPHLRESSRRQLMWMLKHGRHKQNAYYKKLNRELEVELTPYLMEEVKTHGGLPLATFLRDRLGVDSRTNLPVRVHLYELLPGGRLQHIANNEQASGLGPNSRFARDQFHPLTSVAAGLLLGEPKLGCRGQGKCLSTATTGQYGHRYYYLEIPGAAPQVFTQRDGSLSLRRPTQTRVKLNFVQPRIEITQFFSEADAQAIAVLLRKNQWGRAQQLAMSIVGRGTANAFKYPSNWQFTIVHPLVMPGPSSGTALRRVPPLVQQALQGQLVEWVGPQLADYFQNHSNAFIDAAVNEADGLTIRLTIAAPEGFDLLRQYIGGQSAGLPSRIFGQGRPEMALSLQADYVYE